jgi:hypothetical protein
MFRPIDNKELFAEMDSLFDEVRGAIHVVKKTKPKMRLVELMEGVFALLPKKTGREYFYCGMILQFIVKPEKNMSSEGET